MAFATVELEPPEGNIKNGVWTAFRKIWLQKPTEFDAFVADLIGTSFAGGEGVIQGASQTYPGKPWLILDSIDYEPFKDKEKMGGKDYAENQIDALDGDGVAQPALGYMFTLSYKTPTFDQGTLADPGHQDLPELPTDTFLTVRISMGIEVLAIDKAGLKWQVASPATGKFNLGVNTSIAKFVPTETINMTWHRIAFPPWTNIRRLRGTVNNSVFLGHDTETVMFLGLDGSRQFQVNGERQWEIGYKFAVKEVKESGVVVAGWNQFYRDEETLGTHWNTIVHADDPNKKLYESASFGGLFVSEAP